MLKTICCKKFKRIANTKLRRQGEGRKWQGWHNTGRKDLIFIMVPCKGNAHRDESRKHRGGRSGYIPQLPEKGHSEIWNRSGKEKSVIIKINTVIFLLKFFEK